MAKKALACAVLIVCAYTKGTAASELRPIDEGMPREELASRCIAFVDAVEIYQVILAGTLFKYEYSDRTILRAFDWVLVDSTRSAIKILAADPSEVDWAMSQKYITAFGSVGPDTLLEYKPLYQADKRRCLSFFADINSQKP